MGTFQQKRPLCHIFFKFTKPFRLLRSIIVEDVFTESNKWLQISWKYVRNTVTDCMLLHST